MSFLERLREVNGARATAWVGQPHQTTDSLFWAVELGGEVGEALNVVKKLKREGYGWPGSRSSIDELKDEIADIIICTDALARHYGIDLEEAVTAKFNKTSVKVGLTGYML